MLKMGEIWAQRKIAMMTQPTATPQDVMANLTATHTTEPIESTAEENQLLVKKNKPGAEENQPPADEWHAACKRVLEEQ